MAVVTTVPWALLRGDATGADRVHRLIGPRPRVLGRPAGRRGGALSARHRLGPRGHGRPGAIGPAVGVAPGRTVGWPRSPDGCGSTRWPGHAPASPAEGNLDDTRVRAAALVAALRPLGRMGGSSSAPGQTSASSWVSPHSALASKRWSRSLRRRSDSMASSSGVKRLLSTSSTWAMCSGMARSMSSCPAGVSTANAPRRSSGQTRRATRPCSGQAVDRPGQPAGGQRGLARPTRSSAARSPGYGPAG